MSRIFMFNGSAAQESERISATDLREAFQSKNGGLYQFVGERWFKARIRKEANGEGYEIENWIPEEKPDHSLEQAAGQELRREPRPTARSGENSAQKAVMTGKLDPNKPAATEAAQKMAASPSLQERQLIAGAGQPGPGTSTPEAQSQQEKALEEKMLEGATGVQQNQPKDETSKPAAPTPPVSPPPPPRAAVPGGAKEGK